jgi:hypothetical protein
VTITPTESRHWETALLSFHALIHIEFLCMKGLLAFRFIHCAQPREWDGFSKERAGAALRVRQHYVLARHPTFYRDEFVTVELLGARDTALLLALFEMAKYLAITAAFGRGIPMPLRKNN